MEGGDPLGHCLAVSFETTKLPQLHLQLALGILLQNAHRELGLVHIQRGNTTVQRLELRAEPFLRRIRWFAES